LCNIFNAFSYESGYFSDQYKTRGSVYLATRSKAPFCGSQYIFSIRITSDTKRTAGEIVLTFANENVSLTGYEIIEIISVSPSPKKKKKKNSL